MLHLPFEMKPCPGDCGSPCGVAMDRCPVYPKIPPEFQKACQENPHLLQYVRMLPLDKTGMPAYYLKVTRSLKGTKDPNLIYPVGMGVFVHILANKEDIRDYYVAVEPSLLDHQTDTLEKLELRLADCVEELEGIS